jgi:uncharacterized protein YutE (UPF0331/DUF86 family)
MVDRSLVLRKVADLELCKTQMGEYAGVTLEQYRADWKTQRIVERTLQMMIELCSDIASHIISDNRYRTPQSVADAFRVLHENGILDAELLDLLIKMAKFRNIVVHQYERVDAEIVILILRRHLDDFMKFRDAVVRSIRSGGM